MIRTSKHVLSFSNKEKLNIIDQFYNDYKLMLQYYIDLILNKTLSFEKFLSSKELPNYIFNHSVWKQIVYKQAIEIIKSTTEKSKNKVYKKYKYLYSKCIKNNIHQNFTSKRFNELNINYIKRIPKIQIKNISLHIDNRLFNIEKGYKFDEFIKLYTPYFQDNKYRSVKINIPIKYHMYSNRFINENWKRKNTIILRKKDNKFFIDLIWEKKEPKKKEIIKSVGIDAGYKKLISSSSGEYYGRNLFEIYAKIARKEQGSKSFKRALIERDELINVTVKEFIKNESPDQLIIEELKNVKHKSNKYINNKIMSKIQRWSYPKVYARLNLLAEEEGFFIKQVNPAYTSQTCSECGNIDKESRKGEVYLCSSCKIEIDADYNAAVNILHRGVYGPSN